MKLKIALGLLSLFVCWGCSDSNQVSLPINAETSAESQTHSDSMSVSDASGEQAAADATPTPVAGNEQSLESAPAVGEADEPVVIQEPPNTSEPELNSNDAVVPDEQNMAINNDGVVDNSDWVAPEGCIGDVDSNGTQYCVYPETRLFAASTSDGNLWWSFVLPGDNATNEIEAVFVFGDKVGLLADNFPGVVGWEDNAVKLNPYEVSLFEQDGAFISTVSLQQDLNEALYSEGPVGHQYGDAPAQVVVTQGTAGPQLLVNWDRTTNRVTSILSRYDLNTGLAVAQYETKGALRNVSLDPFFVDDVILETRYRTVRLNGTSLIPSTNTTSPDSANVATYRRVTDRVFELSWPIQYFEQAEEGDITYRVNAFTSFVNQLAPDTAKHHVLISLDQYPLPEQGARGISSVQVHRLIDGELDGATLYLAGPQVSRTAPGCEPACDLFKSAAAENLSISSSSSGGGELVLNWSLANNSDIERSLIYRNGNLIGVSENDSFTDRLSNPTETAVYAVIGITNTGAETLPVSAVSNGAGETPLTFKPTSELINSEFVEALTAHSVGRSFFTRNIFGVGCGYENKHTFFDSTSATNTKQYLFNCESDSGVKSGVWAFAKPIPWGGHYSTWRSDEYGFTNFRLRDSVSNELLIVEGDIAFGNGGGGVPDQECIDSWEPSYTERSSYDVNSMSVFSNADKWTISNAKGRVYRTTDTRRNVSEAGDVLGCVQSLTLGADSSFQLTDTLFGVDLNVESSILFYPENPPADAEEEHYRMTITRANGELIVINYSAIGADTAMVMYQQNGRAVTVEVPTASAPFF